MEGDTSTALILGTGIHAGISHSRDVYGRRISWHGLIPGLAASHRPLRDVPIDILRTSGVPQLLVDGMIEVDDPKGLEHTVSTRRGSGEQAGGSGYEALC